MSRCIARRSTRPTTSWSSCRLGDSCYQPTRELPYGRQRLLEIALALATKPQRAAARRAGGRRAAGGKRRDFRSGRGPVERPHAAVHRARHARGVPLRHPHHRAGRRRRVHAKARRTRSPPIRACARSISGRANMAEPLLTLDKVTAGYGDAVVLHDVSLELPEHGSLAVLGRNGVGKSTLLLTIMGYTQLRSGRVTWRGQDISRLAAAPPRRHRHRLGGAGARDFPLADRRGKPHRRGAAGRMDSCNRLQAVSAPRTSGAATWATSCPAASSRCWRLRAR